MSFQKPITAFELMRDLLQKEGYVYVTSKPVASGDIESITYYTKDEKTFLLVRKRIDGVEFFEESKPQTQNS